MIPLAAKKLQTRSFLLLPYIWRSRSSVSKSRLFSTASNGPGSRMCDKLQFDNRILRSLPIDRERKNYRRTVAGACYSVVDPTPVDKPVTVAVSPTALSLLGLSTENTDCTDFAHYFSGSKILPGSQPAAHCYCGHQFGHFSGQLGDGCAHYLGEVVNDVGERWELQLKGSGLTPYSRQGDGRKVLRSSIREFLCSEAMHFLGVPTTRAGSCITSDSKVVRDIFYTGNNIYEKATVISRIAPTFLRFGSFEIFKTQDPLTMRTGPSVGLDELLYKLVDYTIQSYYPKIYSAHPDDRTKRTGAFFQELCVRTARLVALWQCVGFCHGVLNTDNMSIVGITIDYGPYGFLDMYNPGHICNGSDDRGRYAFDKQPSICKWNLRKLSESLSKCLSKQDIEKGIAMYDEEFETCYLERMRNKLGLIKKQLPDDSDLIESFHQTLHKTGCDFTNGFRYLNQLDLGKLQDQRHIDAVVDSLVGECAGPDELVKILRPSMSKNQLLQMKALCTDAPMLLNQLGITAEIIEQELEKIQVLESIESSTVEDKREADKRLWMNWINSYIARLTKENEGISEDELAEASSRRLIEMNKVNPKFILRNYLLQNAIKEAEKGDFSEVNKLLERAQHPYTDDDNDGNIGYFSRPPQEALELKVT